MRSCSIDRADRTTRRLQKRERSRFPSSLLVLVSSSPCTTCRASSSALWGQSIWRFTVSVVRRSCCEEGPGKNLPFSVENKWQLLAMMTLYFGSGFAAPLFIVRHQLLKK
ncbi:cytochrome c oxidase subunit 7C, mitochondrial-like [Rousettus aegyptiacus]|uniref:cytochrome c oxidase subunit 7C, mitochondrial-like n=1 Tax=Rousettus aegyptiacus TaxID=9407 RepID=UPI00168CFB53|nr:cytochrome c oxidase subunit 7C, mitochondrial-like [Rousettus aegyptiacus]